MISLLPSFCDFWWFSFWYDQVGKERSWIIERNWVHTSGEPQKCHEPSPTALVFHLPAAILLPTYKLAVSTFQKAFFTRRFIWDLWKRRCCKRPNCVLHIWDWESSQTGGITTWKFLVLSFFQMWAFLCAGGLCAWPPSVGLQQRHSGTEMQLFAPCSCAVKFSAGIVPHVK